MFRLLWSYERFFLNDDADSHIPFLIRSYDSRPHDQRWSWRWALLTLSFSIKFHFVFGPSEENLVLHFTIALPGLSSARKPPTANYTICSLFTLECVRGDAFVSKTNANHLTKLSTSVVCRLFSEVYERETATLKVASDFCVNFPLSLSFTKCMKECQHYNLAWVIWAQPRLTDCHLVLWQYDNTKSLR